VTERQRPTFRRTPSLSYSGAVRTGRPIRNLARAEAKSDSLYKISIGKSGPKSCTRPLAPPLAFGRRHLAQLRLEVRELETHPAHLRAGPETASAVDVARCARPGARAVGGLGDCLDMEPE